MKSGATSVFLCSALALAAMAPHARAAGNLVINGDFETTSMTSSTEMSGSVAAGTNNVTGWSTSGYNFIFFPDTNGTKSTADSTGSYTPQFNGNITLWGPRNNGAAGNTLGLSPTGGNFVAADGAFEQGAITQTVNNLAIGTNYALSFYWAAGQQSGFYGTTTESWGVQFGNQSYNTATVTTPSQGFTPWTQVTTIFNATAVSQVLSFLAAGTPGGQPPFSLLDGVSLVAAPEPSSWAMMLAGIAGVAALARLRRRPTAAA